MSLSHPVTELRLSSTILVALGRRRGWQVNLTSATCQVALVLVALVPKELTCQVAMQSTWQAQLVNLTVDLSSCTCAQRVDLSSRACKTLWAHVQLDKSTVKLTSCACQVALSPCPLAPLPTNWQVINCQVRLVKSTSWESSLSKTPSAYNIFFANSNRGPFIWLGKK